jgi:tRNA nucleotidyltransferase (CCA-adding enzyme)
MPMKVILTHERADLDALASLLGAHLLYPDAYAVLPREVNRNGATYLHNYGSELGFTKLSQLPQESISQILLVDTQSMVTLKGVTPETRVRVIDHHPLRENLPAEWEADLQNTGACTTLLVEKIKANKIAFNTAQANLLLLGIYEDTGSLSYATTTTRDLLAAVYLLEHGADLNIISPYLNPPLSNSQMTLFDRLMRDITAHKIDGLTILIAKADALDLHDEISTVAHKLRDFLNPDGLIILVRTRQGIRMVARSTTDEIDMAQLARYFDGGGHRRAASALIHLDGNTKAADADFKWNHIIQQVVDYLPEIVHPSIRVHQIMSKKPMTLTPDTPVETVADLMRRYGFEGYPVIENGKVVGLLTRRNVDRALSHKLKATAGMLMETGSVSVTPQDTLEHLQEVMASSGWGQVPVIDPESHEIIGIVTRTDLISTHSGQNNLPSPEDIIQLLQNAIPYSRQVLLRVIGKEGTRLNMPVYIVGGFVRDLLLRQPSQDLDIVVEGDAIAFVNALVQLYGGRAVVHRRFGTAKWIIAEAREALAQALKPDLPLDPHALPESLDLITARTEFYEKPAALPTVESSNIKMDLHRRDFSINTLALRLDEPFFGKLYDFWGGYHDLQNGIIRVLHALSFVDDATRILRALRFAARFEFRIEPRTLSLMQASLSMLNEISGSRLRHEIDLILLEPKVVDIFVAMVRTNVMQAIHPKLPWSLEIKDRLGYLNSPAAQAEWETTSSEKQLNIRQIFGYIYWLEDLPKQDLERVAARLRLPAKVIQNIRQAADLRTQLPELRKEKPSTITAALEVIDPLVITAVYQSTPEATLREPLRAMMLHYRQIKPTVNGDDLRAMGLPPSSRYREILDALRKAWLDGEVGTPEEEQAFLQRLIENDNGRNG